MPVRPAILVFLLGLLAGCGSSIGAEPYFIAGRPPLKEDPQTKQPLLSVCYNSMIHDAASVRDLVAQHCVAPVLRFNRSDLDRCSLAAPVRVTFACSELSRAAAESKPNLPIADNFTGGVSF